MPAGRPDLMANVIICSAAEVDYTESLTSYAAQHGFAARLRVRRSRMFRLVAVNRFGNVTRLVMPRTPYWLVNAHSVGTIIKILWRLGMASSEIKPGERVKNVHLGDDTFSVDLVDGGMRWVIPPGPQQHEHHSWMRFSYI